jgi:hypothetical protein
MIRTTVRSRFSEPVQVEPHIGPASYRLVLSSSNPGDTAGFVALFFPADVLPARWTGFGRGPRAEVHLTDLPPATVLRRLGLATAVCPDCSRPLSRDCAGCPACPHAPDDRKCDNCAPDETPYDAGSPDPDPWFQSPGDARRNGARAL